MSTLQLYINIYTSNIYIFTCTYMTKTRKHVHKFMYTSNVLVTSTPWQFLQGASVTPWRSLVTICIYVYVCMRIYTHTWLIYVFDMHAYIRAATVAPWRSLVTICIYIYVCMRIYVLIGLKYGLDVHVYIPVVMYAYMYAHRFDVCFVYICVCTSSHVCVYIYT